MLTRLFLGLMLFLGVSSAWAAGAPTPAAGAAGVLIIQPVQVAEPFCARPCPVAVAHTQSAAGDAGVKIAAAIASLPSGVGGYVDARGFPNPQNLTGFTIPRGVTVELGSGLYTVPCGNPITINEGARLIGQGSNSPGYTQIKLFNNCNHEVLKLVGVGGEVGTWWHSGMVKDLRIHGNKANNASGTHCVKVFGIGEVSTISSLLIEECKLAGLYIVGSQSGTGSVNNITVNKNGTYGIQLDQIRSGLTLYNVGGDFNPATLGITSPSTGGGSITLIDFKSEKNDAGPAIEYIPGSAGMTLAIVGGNALMSGAADTTFLRITNVAGKVSPLVTIMGLFTGNNYTTIIEDLLTDNTVSSSAVTYHAFLSYTAGKWAKFDTSGWSVSP